MFHQQKCAPGACVFAAEALQLPLELLERQVDVERGGVLLDETPCRVRFAGIRGLPHLHFSARLRSLR